MGVTANKPSLGVGQTWQDVTASRVLGTTYTNNTGKPIMVAVSMTYTANNTFTVTVNGLVIINYALGGSGTSSNPEVTFIVPAGQTYNVAVTGLTLNKWAELS